MTASGLNRTTLLIINSSAKKELLPDGYQFLKEKVVNILAGSMTALLHSCPWSSPYERLC